MEPIRHTCGTVTEPRWMLDGDGDEVIVSWCPTCDTVPAQSELSRAITPEDVPLTMIQQASIFRKPS